MPRFPRRAGLTRDGRGWACRVSAGRVSRTRRSEHVVLVRGAVQEMEVGPPGSPCRGRLQTAAGCAGQVPVVVSAAGKGAPRARQVWVRKASVSEPLMTCRNKFQWRRNRGETWAPGQVWGEPVDCPDGVRHIGGASLTLALARNVRTCRPDTVAGLLGRWREGVPQAAHTARGRVPSRGTGTDRLVVAMKPGNAGGAKGTGHPGLFGGQPALPGGAR